MKPILRLPVLLLGLCCSAGALQAADDLNLNLPGATSQPAAQPAAPAQPQFTEQQLLEMYGWYLGKQGGLSELGFTTPAQIDAIVHGVQLAASGSEAPYDTKVIGPVLGKYMQEKQQAYVEKLKQASETESAAFFAKLKENKNVVVLPDGLCYEIIKPGTGDYPKPNQVVKVNYTGKFINGTVFDSTAGHQPPGPTEIGLEQVIPGWTEGIQKINAGGQIRLYIPGNLAYGDQPPRGMLPNATLIFDVELLSFKDAPPAASAPAPTDTPHN
ncbi:MAG TPA: FKBP-type peptidyl-prolyl cis-trans isomerase [Opitutaceae bacterium]|jgi:FKBP-type peptidyl-prolyl cis-trans isomerase|nr:FKBP-type peptidyl-prolyl cis-trans isomerase [Opitutaceae bacterium]